MQEASICVGDKEWGLPASDFAPPPTDSSMLPEFTEIIGNIFSSSADTAEEGDNPIEPSAAIESVTIVSQNTQLETELPEEDEELEEPDEADEDETDG